MDFTSTPTWSGLGSQELLKLSNSTATIWFAEVLKAKSSLNNARHPPLELSGDIRLEWWEVERNPIPIIFRVEGLHNEGEMCDKVRELPGLYIPQPDRLVVGYPTSAAHRVIFLCIPRELEGCHWTRMSPPGRWGLACWGWSWRSWKKLRLLVQQGRGSRWKPKG